MAEIICEPLQPIKSSAQMAVDDNLSKPVEPFRTFAITGKTGDVTVPANVHIRFYNCNFDKFKAVEGNNIFYFESCTFNDQVEMKEATFIAAGSHFIRGAVLTTCKGELIPHTVPSTSEGGASELPCRVNDTLYLRDHCQVSSRGSIFEWLDSAAAFLGEVADFFTDLDSALKSILSLLDFSRFESVLDQFLNIPFAILNMVNGCVANISRMIISQFDKLLAPIFNVISSAQQVINSINRLISTIKSIPQRIANLYKRCYAKIVNSGELLAKQVLFSIDSLSRVDVMLTKRLVCLEGSIAQLKDNSKCMIKNVKTLASPGKGTFAAMFKLDTMSFAEVAHIDDIVTASAGLVSVKNKSLYKFFAAKKIESASENTTPLIKANNADVELTKVGECKTLAAPIAKATDGAVVRLNAINKIDITSNTTSVFEASTNAVIYINNNLPYNAFTASLLQPIG